MTFVRTLGGDQHSSLSLHPDFGGVIGHLDLVVIIVTGIPIVLVVLGVNVVN